MEARNIGAALSCGIRVIQPVIVGEIVCRKRAPTRVGVDAERALVVAKILVVRRGREVAFALIGLRNVWQNRLRRRGPGTLRDLCIWQDARLAGGAAFFVVRFARSYCVAQLLREQIGPILAVNRTRK